jgi:hypothetical protein
MTPRVPSQQTDSELIAELKRLVGRERASTVDLIVHLAEFDRRRLYLGAGFSSLFTYCTEELRLSEHAAYHRILAARMARRYPVVLERLALGSLTLTAVRLLAPYLDAANHEELLTVASGKGKRVLQELLARRFPQPDVVSSIRKLPAHIPAPGPPLGFPASAGLVSSTPLIAESGAAQSAEPSPHVPVSIDDGVPSTATEPASSLAASVGASLATCCVSSPSAKHRPAVTPLAPERYQITFTASSGTREKLRLAQDLMRHTIPSGDTATIFDEALTALIEKAARRKFADTTQPRASRRTADGSRHVSASVRRAVWVRDLGCCAFMSGDGRRCGERGFVEFHHVVPYGVGGPPTVDNLELRCRAHNAYEANLYYGTRRAN